MSKQSDKLHIDRLMLIGEMASGIIHDINNPLSIAIASIELTKFNLEDLKSEENSENIDKVLKYINNIELSLSRIAEISESVRVLSYKDQSNQMSDINLILLLKDVNSFCKSFLYANEIDLTISCDQNICIKGNRTMLTQLFVNLVKNANDAILNSDVFNKWISIDAGTEDSFVVIKITDGGSGIPSEIAEKIFDSFFTTKALGVGTGLGLGLCKQIVEHHNGTLNYNKDNSNTQFIIKINNK